MGLWPYRLTASRLQVERQDLRDVDQMMHRFEGKPEYDGQQRHMLFWTRAQCFREILCRAAEGVNYEIVSPRSLSAIMNHCHMASALLFGLDGCSVFHSLSLCHSISLTFSLSIRPSATQQLTCVLSGSGWRRLGWAYGHSCAAPYSGGLDSGVKLSGVKLSGG